MKTKIAPRKPTLRLNTGSTILMNAQAVNTKPVKGRLNAFTEAHHSYCEAHTKVDEAEKALGTQQALVAKLDGEQDDTVHALAVSLVNGGQPLTNAFAGFSDLGPGTIKGLPYADAVAAIHALVESVRRSKVVSQDTRNAAETAEQAAQKVAAALPALETLADSLRVARGLRDTYAQRWDAELSDLRLAARSANREVPGLFAALFGRSRAPKKTNGTAKQPAPAPVTTTPAAAADISTTPTAGEVA